MPGIIIPDARGGLVLIHGSDGSSIPVKVSVDSDGHLQVDALSSALPAGAATASNQSTEIASLQLIDDLRNALASVASDSLRSVIVSFPAADALGNIALRWYASWTWVGTQSSTPAGDLTVTSSAVAANRLLVLESVSAYTNLTRNIDLQVVVGGQTVLIGSGLQSANWESIIRTGQLVLNAGDTVKVVFYALTAGQTVGWSAMGYLVRTA